MAKTHLKGRGGGARQRSVAAAARAAGKRAERAREAERPTVIAGPTVVVETQRTAESDSPAGPPVPERGTQPEPEPDERETAGSVDGDRDGDGGRKESAGATTEAEKKPQPRRLRSDRFRGRPRLFRGLLAVVTLAAVTAAALLGWEYREAQLTDRARAEATDVAREVAPKILSYDHRHLKRDFQDARVHLTGSFQKEFADTTEKVVTPTAEKYDGVVKATVARPPGGGAPAVSVVSASPDEVVVLLFMNQVTESKKLDKPRMDLNRVRMTLVDTSGGWKVRAVDAL